jgi:hypothetical protein
MCHVRLSGNDLVNRAAQLHREILTDDGRKLPLSEAIKEAHVLGRYELHLRTRPGVAARTAQLELSVVRVTYPRPSRTSPWVKQCGIKKLTMNVVIVQEVNARQRVKPIR